MAGRKRPAEGTPHEIKSFTLAEIESGINKLNRRIEEVKNLSSYSVDWDDQRVTTANHNIQYAIREVFGENSFEATNNTLFKIGSSCYGGNQEYVNRDNLRSGIEDAINLLKGLIDRLNEKKVDLAQDSSNSVRAAFEGLDLHPRIANVCVDLYRDGHYRNAVLDASLSLINMVKEKSRKHDLDGTPLMRMVFSKNKPILAFNDLKDQTDLDEQEGFMHLFEGAALALRNPRAHEISDDSPEQALEYIAFLSLLAKQVDSSKKRTVD